MIQNSIIFYVLTRIKYKIFEFLIDINLQTKNLINLKFKIENIAFTILAKWRSNVAIMTRCGSLGAATKL